jgi:ABC-type multidrug transport system ATPase subunit
LSGRLGKSKGSTITGSVSVNGLPRDYETFKKRTAYVEQDDAIFAELTVREQITGAALLRLPSGMPKDRKLLRVDRVIDELGLAKCADSRVGGELVKGISGGERKRVAIGSELVTDSPLLFLDEPTSGLDSFNSVNVMSSLRKLASNGRTIVCTIHQPRSSIFALFDKILLLSEGRAVYFGDAQDALPYFRSLQFPSPEGFNPADFFLDLISVDPRTPELELDTKARVDFLANNYKAVAQPIDVSPPRDAPADAAAKGKAKEFETGWFNEFHILATRSLKIAVRAQTANAVRTGQTVFFAVLLSALWFNNGRGDDFKSRNSLIGLLSFILINQCFGSVFAVIFDYPLEREIVTRERASSSYRTSAYFVSKTFTELPRSLFFSLISTVIMYFAVGFKPEFFAFVKFYLIILLVAAFGDSLAVFISILTGDAEISAALAPLFVITAVLFGGIFSGGSTIPDWIEWIKWLSFVFYGLGAFGKNEFPGEPFGERIISGGNFNDLSYWENTAALFGLVMFLKVVGYLTLHYLRGPKFLKF